MRFGKLISELEKNNISNRRRTKQLRVRNERAHRLQPHISFIVKDIVATVRIRYLATFLHLYF